MKIYLAHAFDTRKEMRIWELEMEAKYPGLELFNPFYDCDRPDVREIDAGESDRFEKLDPDILVRRDLSNMMQCDGVFAFITGEAHSKGTHMEIVYASLFRQPVFIMCSDGDEKHPWLQYHAQDILVNMEDMEKFIHDFQEQLTKDYSVPDVSDDLSDLNLPLDPGYDESKETGGETALQKLVREEREAKETAMQDVAFADEKDVPGQTVIPPDKYEHIKGTPPHATEETKEN